MKDYVWYECKFPHYFVDNEDGYEIRVFNKKEGICVYADVLKEKEYLELREIIHSDKMALLNISNDDFKDVAKLKIKVFPHKVIPDISDPSNFIDENSYYL
jgi:hypothetical protein